MFDVKHEPPRCSDFSMKILSKSNTKFNKNAALLHMNIAGIISGNMQLVHVKDTFIGQPQVCKYPADEGAMTDAAPVVTLTTSHLQTDADRNALPSPTD